MTDQVRWGILGCAGIANRGMIPGLKQTNMATLAAVSSRTLAKAQAFAQQHGATKAYGSYDALLADPEIEVVYVPLPNGLHAEWSIKAMRAGKHVLCEKPIAMDAAQAREIQAVRDETGKLCIEAYAYRFNPVVAKAFEIAQSGVLGELRFINTCTSSNFIYRGYDPTNVRVLAGFGGGALYDVGCYAINAQRMLAGREPLSAWATMNWSQEFDVDMSGSAVLEFSDGLKGTLSWGFETGHAGPQSISGADGKLIAPYGWAAPAGKPALLLITGSEMHEITVTPASDFQREVQDMSEAVRGIRPPTYAAEPLEATMRVIDACYKSYQTGQVETI